MKKMYLEPPCFGVSSQMIADGRKVSRLAPADATYLRPRTLNVLVDARVYARSESTCCHRQTRSNDGRA